MARVPYRFINSTPPVSENDIDAEKLNDNFDSLSSGGAISDGAITDRHINTQTILPTFFIKKFISSDDLSRTPLQLGVSNGDMVAINDTDQDKEGKLYKVVSGQWSLFKNKILHMEIINNLDGRKYRLILNANDGNYYWSIDVPVAMSSKKESLTGNGTNQLILLYIPLDDSTIVWIGGNLQMEGVDYMVSGKVLTFSDILDETMRIYIKYNY